MAVNVGMLPKGNSMHQAETLQSIMAGRKARHSLAPAAGPMVRVISITSGKGGVGKTNVTANLAAALQRLGKKVLILDADLNLANIDVLLGLTPRYNLQHVFSGERSLAEVLITAASGFSILPGSSGILELADLDESQKLFFLEEMEGLGRDLDFLLVDTAAGINGNVVYFNLAAQERIVLLTPEPTSMTDAYALIKVLSSRYDVKRFRILVNLARSDREGKTVFRKLSEVADRFLDTISLDYLGHLPLDDHLPRSVRKQQLVVEGFPSAPFSAALAGVAEQLAGERPETSAAGSIQFFWRGMMTL
ncbi:MAG: MinD/ParA family protein [Thermodesulfobacteriota bacterium]